MTGTTKTVRSFTPLPWQIPVWRDRSLVVLMDGPAGTGKSHIAANKLDGYLRKYPSATGLMVRKTRESMTNSTLLFYDRVIVGNDPHVQLKKHDKRFEYANGSICAYGGMKDDAQREALRSIGLEGGLDIIWVEEAHLFTLNDYEELLTRLRGKAAYNYYLSVGCTPEQAERLAWVQIILTTNPDSNRHWIYQNLIMGLQASRHLAKTEENIHNPKSYATQVLGRLTGVRRKRMKDGLWVSAEGAVFSEWRHELHVIEPFEIPKTWKRFRSFDFGYRNPLVCQWWAVDGDGRLYLYREIYMTERTVRRHVDDIWRIEANIPRGKWDEMDEDEKRKAWQARGTEYHLIQWSVADHDSEDRATLEEMGIDTLPAEKAIRRGIDAMSERLLDAGDGKARLYIFNDALVEEDQQLTDAKKPICTADEIPAYVYANGVDGKPNKEAPVDLDNHGIDAARYAVMSVDGEAAVEPVRRAKAQYGN